MPRLIELELVGWRALLSTFLFYIVFAMWEAGGHQRFTDSVLCHIEPVHTVHTCVQGVLQPRWCCRLQVLAIWEHCQRVSRHVSFDRSLTRAIFTCFSELQLLQGLGPCRSHSSSQNLAATLGHSRPNAQTIRMVGAGCRQGFGWITGE